VKNTNTVKPGRVAGLTRSLASGLQLGWAIDSSACWEEMGQGNVLRLGKAKWAAGQTGAGRVLEKKLGHTGSWVAE
jgi:hypothetical protein